ncbi:MAG: 6-phosphogluconolactonase [Ignavibacteriales bacterium]|nr:6-phosphogluconolactonase [Ignavibacteriales bacterium]
MTPHPTIRTFLSADHLSLGAAQEFVRIVNSAIETRGVCNVALAGGETPRRMYIRLAKAPFAHAVDWSKVHLFFGDERAVPPTDYTSNFGMVDLELLSHIDIPYGNVHRMVGEINPDEAARRYERELERAFGQQEVRFDLVLLGLGEDGHTASLFPKTTSIDDEQSLVCAVYVPQLESWRISLTFLAINNARGVLFLVAGGSKASILERVLSAKEATKELPATLVMPKEGTLLWMVDQDASVNIKGRIER